MGDFVRCADCQIALKDKLESLYIVCPANHDELRDRHTLRPCKQFQPKGDGK